MRLDTPERLHARFDALTALLRRQRPLWGPRPFVQLPVSWEAGFPEVAAWLDAAEAEVGFADAPPTLRAWAEEAEALGALPPLSVREAAPLPLRATRGVPGRKLSQIEHFAAATLAAWPPDATTVVDWCAGKGHLGRGLCHHTGAALRALEWDPALAAQGEARCAAEGVRADFRCLDARTPEAGALLEPAQQVVALHACGDLHAALLRAAVSRPVAGLALAPCCYNRAAPDRGHALSAAGRAADLPLDGDDLDLIHRDDVVARDVERRRAHQTRAWRLGFDLLQRALSGHDAYRTMAPFPVSWLALSFPEFCGRFATLGGVHLPEEVEVAPYEAAGWARFEAVRRRDRVRNLFRAPLEAWLVLDRALLLVEHGFEVEVGTFCPRTVTPRNAMIRAQSPHGR